jgi:Ca2+-binding RTX toxin-like protein
VRIRASRPKSNPLRQGAARTEGYRVRVPVPTRSERAPADLRRFGRVAGAMLLGSAVALLVVPAAAAPTCAFDGQTGGMTVVVGTGESAVIARSGEAITLDGAQCDTATVTTTDAILVDGSAGGANVTLDLSGGPFEPGMTPDPDGTSEIEFNLVVPGPSNVVFAGGSGDDHLVLGSDGANLNAAETPGDVDVLIDGTPAVAMKGNAGADVVSVGGGAGTGSPSAATLLGGADDDLLLAGLGDSAFDGGDGLDAADYAAASAIVADLATGLVTHAGGGQDQLAAVESFAGSHGADEIVGDDQPNVIRGGAGDDLISGGAGDDALDGEAGTDTVDYTGAPQPVVVILSAGTAAGEGTDSLDGFENAVGSSFGDILIGGGGGVNALSGRSGDDRIDGGTGNDALAGGHGVDTLEFGSASVGVEVDLRDGTSKGQGDDTVAGFENVLGTERADTIHGDDGRNVITGGSGADQLFAHGGRDVVKSGGGSDRASGQRGNDDVGGGKGKDQLDGGDGRDRCTGGPDPDSFVYCEKIRLH